MDKREQVGDGEVDPVAGEASKAWLVTPYPPRLVEGRLTWQIPIRAGMARFVCLPVGKKETDKKPVLWR